MMSVCDMQVCRMDGRNVQVCIICKFVGWMCISRYDVYMSVLKTVS